VKLLMAFMLVVVLSVFSTAADINIVDYIGDVDTAGQYIDSILSEQGYSVQYRTSLYYSPTEEARLFIIFTGHEHELDQMQSLSIVEYLRSGRELMIFGDGAYGVSVFWCGTDIATAIVYPIGTLTGEGVLSGFVSGCCEASFNVSSSCIGGGSDVVLSGDFNICSSRGTVFQDTIYGYKTAVFSIKPMHIVELLPFMNLMLQNYFGIFPTGIIDGDGEYLPVCDLTFNSPNPFNTATKINYYSEKPVAATVDVFNITGQKVARLFDGCIHSGSNSFIWRAENASSGIYFYRITAGSSNVTRAMTLIK
jgi:hypothetical protein